MKAIVSGIAATVLIAVLAWFGLNNAGFSSRDVQSGANVRLD